MEYKATATAQIREIMKAIHSKKRFCTVKQQDKSNDEYSSYWDGGSKDVYSVYNFSTKTLKTMPTNHPYFEAGKSKTLPTLSADEVVVEHGVFCGKDSQPYIYAANLSILGL